MYARSRSDTSLTGVAPRMDRHLFEALIESFTDVIADKVAERLRSAEPPSPPPIPLRPPVKAASRPAPSPEPEPPPPALSTPAEPEPEAEYLTTDEAAQLLRVSPKGLEGMRCKGRGPKYVKIGGRVRYRRSDLV
jgi:hypothetical protein